MLHFVKLFEDVRVVNAKVAGQIDSLYALGKFGNEIQSLAVGKCKKRQIQLSESGKFFKFRCFLEPHLGQSVQIFVNFRNGLPGVLIRSYQNDLGVRMKQNIRRSSLPPYPEPPNIAIFILSFIYAAASTFLPTLLVSSKSRRPSRRAFPRADSEMSLDKILAHLRVGDGTGDNIDIDIEVL